MANKYGLNNTNKLIAKAMQGNPTLFEKELGKIKILKDVKGLKDTELKEANAVNKNIMRDNNEAIESFLSVAKQSTLLANELNDQLVNVVSDIKVNDGLDLSGTDYDIFHISDKEFGDLALHYDLDIMDTGLWVGDYDPEEDENPQFVPAKIGEMKTEDKMRVGYRNNASIYGGAFMDASDPESYLAKEHKKGVDTEVNFVLDTIGQNIKDTTAIKIHIPGFDTEETAIESSDIINNVLASMTQRNRDYNEAGYLRAEADLSNIVLIGNTYYLTKTNREKANVFSPEFINSLGKIKSFIKDNKAFGKNEILATVPTRYPWNKRLNSVLSHIQSSTGNSITYRHSWIRRGVITAQQAVLFTTDVSAIDISEYTVSAGSVSITGTVSVADTYTVQAVNMADHSQITDLATGAVEADTETTVEATLPYDKQVVRVVDANSNILWQKVLGSDGTVYSSSENGTKISKASVVDVKEEVSEEVSEKASLELKLENAKKALATAQKPAKIEKWKATVKRLEEDLDKFN